MVELILVILEQEDYFIYKLDMTMKSNLRIVHLQIFHLKYMVAFFIFNRILHQQFSYTIQNLQTFSLYKEASYMDYLVIIKVKY